MRHRFRKISLICIALLLVCIYLWRGGWAELWLRSYMVRTSVEGSPHSTSNLAWDFEQWRRQLPAAGVTRERWHNEATERFLKEWPPELSTSCADLDRPGNRPVICIRRISSESYTKGEAIAADIEWKNLPQGAGLMVHLLHDVSPDLQHDYLGPQGPMEQHARPLKQSGSMRFKWAGTGFPCAPTDFPMICHDPIEVGRYRLHAKVHATTKVVAVRGLAPYPTPAERTERSATETVIHTASAPFEVTGTPDLHHVTRAINWAAIERYMSGGAGPLTSSSFLSGDLKGGGLELRARLGRLCSNIPAKPPWRSTLEGCVLTRDVQDAVGVKRDVQQGLVTLTGDLTLMPNAMPEGRAFDQASLAAARQLGPRMRGLKFGKYLEGDRDLPYISYDRGERAYRPDLGGIWYIEITAILAGGSAAVRRDYPDIAERFLVRVEKSGESCVIATRPYRGEGFSWNLEKDRIDCKL